MSHKSVRDFLEAKVLGLGDHVKFGYGRASDFNAIKDKGYPYVWCDPLTSTLNIIDGLVATETYNVTLVFYKYDKADSTEEEYKLILDSTDSLVQQFIRDLNEDLESGSLSTLVTGNTELSAITKEPVIKVMADVLTGWIVRFSLTVPDKFDYC